MLKNGKIAELTGWVNWNYVGLFAGILSVAVTLYNINGYLNEIKRVEKQ